MATDFLLGVAAAWILCGLVVAFIMRRRGHEFFVWLALGSVLGPLSIPLAFDKLRQDHLVEFDDAAGELSGRFDVLAGLDNSRESVEALESALALVGDNITSLTLATVLSHDAKDSYSGQAEQAEALAYLESVAAKLDSGDIRTQILFGQAAASLIDFASARGIELIVIGPRGRGASEAMFGSVARTVVSKSEIPVLVGRPLAAHPLPQIRPD